MTSESFVEFPSLTQDRRVPAPGSINAASMAAGSLVGANAPATAVRVPCNRTNFAPCGVAVGQTTDMPGSARLATDETTYSTEPVVANVLNARFAVA